MRNTLVLASVVFLAGNATNCNLTAPAHPPAAGFSHSLSTFMCGPADGPATAILLAREPIQGLQPAYPYVTVVIQRSASALAGTTWILGTNVGDVGAIYWTASDQRVEATSGTVRIDRVVAQQRVEGSVELRFPSQSVTESFNAPWIESFMLCG